MASPSRPASVPDATSHSYSLANFRSSLTALVVLHHTAISYGGHGVGVYQSTLHPPSSSTALVAFNALNQSFFMGSFFYLSGHFSKRSLQRKSRTLFVKDRLYRLGVPTLVYTLLGPPICTALLRQSRGDRVGLGVLTEHLKSLRGVRGPVWFTALLLVFDLGLAARSPQKDPTNGHNNTKSHIGRPQTVSTPSLLLALALCAGVDFIWRILFPVGSYYRLLSLNLGYLPQYIAAYVFGTQVDDPSYAIPTGSAIVCLLLPSIASSMSLAKSVRSGPSSFHRLEGGYNGAAANYAVWNNFTGYLMGSTLLAAFLRYCNLPLRSLADAAYPAFLVHMPVSMLVEVSTDHISASSVVKTAAVGTLNVICSWLVGYGAKRLFLGRQKRDKEV